MKNVMLLETVTWFNSFWIKGSMEIVMFSETFFFLFCFIILFQSLLTLKTFFYHLMRVLYILNNHSEYVHILFTYFSAGKFSRLFFTSNYSFNQRLKICINKKKYPNRF